MLFLIEMMLYLVFTSIIGSMGMKASSMLKENVTEVEMELIVNAIEAHEIKKNELPADLDALSKHFKGTSYKTDAWDGDYTYSTGDRELCSVNDYWGTSPNDEYCVNF